MLPRKGYPWRFSTLPVIDVGRFAMSFAELTRLRSLVHNFNFDPRYFITSEAELCALTGLEYPIVLADYEKWCRDVAPSILVYANSAWAMVGLHRHPSGPNCQGVSVDLFNWSNPKPRFLAKELHTHDMRDNEWIFAYCARLLHPHRTSRVNESGIPLHTEPVYELEEFMQVIINDYHQILAFQAEIQLNYTIYMSKRNPRSVLFGRGAIVFTSASDLMKNHGKLKQTTIGTAPIYITKRGRPLMAFMTHWWWYLQVPYDEIKNIDGHCQLSFTPTERLAEPSPTKKQKKKKPVTDA